MLGMIPVHAFLPYPHLGGNAECQIGMSLSSSPSISIGLPVFNGERYLAATLESLLGQSHGDLEIVACDNASTDDTAAILAQFAARDPRVRVHGSDANRGAAWNYNRCVELARGRYFKWASHDDLLEPEHLERCLAAIQAVPGAVLSYPRTRLIGPEGEFLSEYDDRLDLQDERPSARLARLLRQMRLCNPVFGLIRRDVLLESSRIGAYVSSDEVLLVELALRGKFVEVPQRMFLRRQHPESCFGGGKSLEEVALWFDPGTDLKSFLPRTQKLARLFCAIERAPLWDSERLRCFWALLRNWPLTNWRVIAGELRRLLTTRVRGMPSSIEMALQR
jgi:glycosyltransferase involved in cell wall biosynthesis